MTVPLQLEQDGMAVLLDVHNILMARNADESKVLQSVCEKLFSLLSLDLVWGALIGLDNKITVTGAAGKAAEEIKGLILDNDVSASALTRQLLDNRSPICFPGGLIELNSRLFGGLSSDIRTVPLALYPLTFDSRCMGVLGVSANTRKPSKNYEHTLLQLTAQHAGFALSLLKSFIAKDSSQNDLKLAAAVFDNSLEGIFITDTSGTILAANAAVTKITGYETDELLGQNPRLLKSDRHGQDFYQALWTAVYQNNQWEGEIWNKRKNGEVYPEWLSISAIKNNQGAVQNYIGIFIDISKQKEAESRLSYLAQHDKLTGLPNRDLFLDRLNMAILHAKRTNREIAVLFIDLDHFKYVNDTFGHANGDQVLQKIALKLKLCLRENDTLARMGGDEFTVILQDFNNRSDVERTSCRILQTLEKPIRLDVHDLYVSASIGVSIYPDDGDNAALIMKHADTAMYGAKNGGRSRLQFFQASMESYAHQRIEMEQHLRNALLHDEFQLYYQPQIDLDSGRVIGAEALLRWRRPEVGTVLPGQFISLAEETGMILPIGEWVFREVCRQYRNWGYYPFRIGVNLSAHQFRQAGIAATIAQIMEEHAIEPGFLDLELTETVAMQHVDGSLKTLNELKQLGLQISIDDFGTGYSSLSYLKQFPIDRLKIDRAFIADITTDPNDAAIVVAIIAMAHSLGLSVIAEGVETEEQLKFLKMHGCDEGQGYFFGHPIPAEEFLKIISP